MLTQVGERLRTTQDVPMVRRDLLVNARHFYDTLLLRHDVNTADRRRAGEAYIRLSIAFFDLGDYREAERNGRDAMALWANVLTDPAPDWLRVDQAQAERVAGSVLWFQNRHVEALELFERAVGRLSGVVADHPNDVTTRITWAEVLSKQAGVCEELGRDAQAEAAFRAALRVVDECPFASDSIGLATAGASASAGLGSLLAQTGRPGEGLAAQERAVAFLRPVVARDPQLVGPSHCHPRIG